MLTLISASSIGFAPVRGGLTFLLASAAAGYWQSWPRPAGATNAGSLPSAAGCGAPGSTLVVVEAEAVVAESLLVMMTVAATAPTTTSTPVTDAMMVIRRCLLARCSRRSSWRSSLRLAAARRCSLVGTAAVLLGSAQRRLRVHIGTECARRF